MKKFKMLLIVLLLLPLIYGNYILYKKNKIENFSWYFGGATLFDEVHFRKLILYNKEGKVVDAGAPGSMIYFSDQLYKRQQLFFSGTGRASNATLPAKISAVWASFIDKTYYGMEFDLPDNLEQIIRSSKNGITKYEGYERSAYNLMVGVTPGGYYEVYLNHHVERPILLGRGMATNLDKAKAHDESWYPLSAKAQFKNRFSTFDKNYAQFIEENPIPYWRFQLDQPSIVETVGLFPENVWGNRQPSQEWLDNVEAQRRAYKNENKSCGIYTYPCED